MTLGDLFDSYDEAKIHSHPGVRYDLFPGGEAEGRNRLVMDFFGNVQNVEVEGGEGGNASEWKDDLVQLGKMIAERRRANLSDPPPPSASAANVDVLPAKMPVKRVGAAKVEAEPGWTKNLSGAWALAGCGIVWAVGSWVESKR